MHETLVSALCRRFAAHAEVLPRVCPALAAEIHQLHVLVEHLEDNPNNRTRFLVLGYNEPEPTGNDKTSIMFSIPHRSGELFRAMAAFEKFDVNLNTIESRPSRVAAWEYVFYIDVQGHKTDLNVKKAIAQLEEHSLFVTIIGSYPAAV